MKCSPVNKTARFVGASNLLIVFALSWRRGFEVYAVHRHLTRASQPCVCGAKFKTCRLLRLRSNARPRAGCDLMWVVDHDLAAHQHA